MEDRREQGVGFAIRNRLLPMVEPGDYKSERVMHIKLNIVTGTIHLVSAYAPTLTSSSDIKDAFYSELEDFIKRVPKNHPLIILGDFNALIMSRGRPRVMAHLPWACWCWQVQRKWSAAPRALHTLSALHYQYILCGQEAAPCILDALKIQALAPAGPYYHPL